MCTEQVGHLTLSFSFNLVAEIVNRKSNQGILSSEIALEF
uniref:Uncharacterized protein n=1 Tax=Rhizophora mucronata TaxID=61149 RepID=A0A2P2P1J3_RHIMU